MTTNALRKYDTVLTTHVQQLRATGWSDDRADAAQIEWIVNIRDELRRGERLWDVSEIVSVTHQVQKMAANAGSTGKEALTALAQELEAHLPTPDQVEADAAQVREDAGDGYAEAARARHLLLWSRVLEMVAEGRGDAPALAKAALGAYDEHTERFILEHLATN